MLTQCPLIYSYSESLSSAEALTGFRWGESAVRSECRRNKMARAAARASARCHAQYGRHLGEVTFHQYSSPGYAAHVCRSAKWRPDWNVLFCGYAMFKYKKRIWMRGKLENFVVLIKTVCLKVFCYVAMA